jgi:hypothetical protein
MRRRAAPSAATPLPRAGSEIDIVKPVTSAIICAQNSDRARRQQKAARSPRAGRVQNVDAVGGAEKATPSMTAKTSVCAVAGAGPAKVAVASASLWGVRSPLR